MKKFKYYYKYYFIYSITNQINNKQYVGFHATNDLNDDYMGSGIAFHRALKKYGLENFEKEILENCNELNWREKEKFWVKKLDTYRKGYNMTLGGEGTLGLKLSDNAKQKIAKSKTGNKIPNNVRKKISHSLMGRSTWNKDQNLSEEHKEKISKANKGRIKSQEEILKLSEAKKGSKNPGCRKEVKEKVSKSLKGKFIGANNPMSGSSRSKKDLEKYKKQGIKLKGDRWEYMRKKIKCINLKTKEEFIFDGVKELCIKLDISKNKYYRALKNPKILPLYKFETII